MSKVKATDIRKGLTLYHENELFIVHESDRVAKGNWRSYMNVKLKNFKTGKIMDFRFNMDDQFEIPFVEDRPFEYLYRDGDNYVLMNTDTFDQLMVSKDLMPDADNYLKGNEKVQCKLLNGDIVGVDLPNTVELEVTDAPPVVKGATATNQTKEIVVETGYKLRAPPFITIGEKIRIDTRTGEYMSRV